MAKDVMKGNQYLNIAQEGGNLFVDGRDNPNKDNIFPFTPKSRSDDSPDEGQYAQAT